LAVSVELVELEARAGRVEPVVLVAWAVLVASVALVEWAVLGVQEELVARAASGNTILRTAAERPTEIALPLTDSAAPRAATRSRTDRQARVRILGEPAGSWRPTVRAVDPAVSVEQAASAAPVEPVALADAQVQVEREASADVLAPVVATA
jgi:hypothetical protein